MRSLHRGRQSAGVVTRSGQKLTQTMQDTQRVSRQRQGIADDFGQGGQGAWGTVMDRGADGG